MCSPYPNLKTWLGPFIHLTFLWMYLSSPFDKENMQYSEIEEIWI